MRPPLLFACFAVGFTACGGGEIPRVELLAGVDTMVTPESELLALPADVEVDTHGRVYVLDQTLSQLVRLDGSRTEVLARRGHGPGELESPLALGVRGDTVQVDDRGNRRVVVLDTDGVYGRSFPLPPRLPGAMAIGPQGEVAVGTDGLSPSLVGFLDPRGEMRGSIGQLAAPAAVVWDFTAIKAQIRSGQVPSALRNSTQPVLTERGSWLVLVSEGEVRRYDAAGRALWTRRLKTPEMQAIRGAFFAANRQETSPAAFWPLTYFADADPLDDELLLLLNTPDDEPSAVLVLGPDGTVRRRLVLTGVQGARDLAVDAVRRRLYLSVPSSASVVSVPLPAKL